MGVFSYLNLKRPAALIWRTFSPGRELGPDKAGTSDGDGGEDTGNNEIKQEEDVVTASVDQSEVVELPGATPGNPGNNRGQLVYDVQKR